MNHRNRIYLDHAATSWPKNEAVLFAMDDYARHCGAAAGRGSYSSAVDADRIVSKVRRQIAELINAPSPSSVSLHASGTAALNAAIHGLLRPGDHVVTTAAEHNSVLRPLHHWQTHHDVRLTIVPTDGGGLVDANELLASVTDSTRMVTLTSASNVTGTVQPVDRVARALSTHPAIMLCDAAQTFGVLPIDVRGSSIDVLAAPGHKGSGGPFGTGFLYVAERFHGEIKPMIHGGTGSQSESLEMPPDLPMALEAGNLNLPALAGWSAALGQIDIDRRASHHAELAKQMYHAFRSIRGVRVHGGEAMLPIASLTLRDGSGHSLLSPSDIAAILDSEFGIETRAGLHCAARVHPCIGSDPEGTLRISGGFTTTGSEIDAVVQAIAKIADG